MILPADEQGLFVIVLLQFEGRLENLLEQVANRLIIEGTGVVLDQLVQHLPLPDGVKFLNSLFLFNLPNLLDDRPAFAHQVEQLQVDLIQPTSQFIQSTQAPAHSAPLPSAKKF